MLQQLDWLYAQLQGLRAGTLVQIIDELRLDIPDNEYKEMATSIYEKARRGEYITHQQKRVLVNIIGKPRV